MKTVYYFRLFFISYEFIFLLAVKFTAIELNEGAVNWAMLFPIGVSI